MKVNVVVSWLPALLHSKFFLFGFFFWEGGGGGDSHCLLQLIYSIHLHIMSTYTQKGKDKTEKK